jgi:hypothetical protein
MRLERVKDVERLEQQITASLSASFVDLKFGNTRKQNQQKFKSTLIIVTVRNRK